GSGKTHLLYLITSFAILPSRFHGTEIGGKNAAIVVLDPLSHFDVERLAQITIHHIICKLNAAGRWQEGDEATQKEIKELLEMSLKHIHIFRPQSHVSLVATLEELKEYLFNDKAHHSIHRPIHSIILDPADAFYWPLRASSLPSTSSKPSPSVTAEYTKLATHLIRLSRILSCAILLTTSSISPAQPFRSIIPPSFSDVRLALRRVRISRFSPALSVEEAERERDKMGEVVSRGRFECWKVGQGRHGEKVEFRITGWGVNMEQDTDGG
ncbi:hypothetical protein K469DRAFT_609921, partial [Zopfia rhizophila CBS 207.26]